MARQAEGMSFAETYAEERLESRRIRAERARFWAKCVSLILMLTVALALRSEPQLRQALMSAGVDGIAALAGQKPGRATPDLGEAELAALQEWQARLDAGAGVEPAPQPQTGLRDAVKVNRFGTESATSPDL